MPFNPSPFGKFSSSSSGQAVRTDWKTGLRQTSFDTFRTGRIGEINEPELKGKSRSY
ncbi:MAG: hypothetical protein LBD67_10195 [Candidatus Accumulibacter sp.]|nr:hypothetical protein [Accumulibacter sp.]